MALVPTPPNVQVNRDLVSTRQKVLELLDERVEDDGSGTNIYVSDFWTSSELNYYINKGINMFFTTTGIYNEFTTKETTGYLFTEAEADDVNNITYVYIKNPDGKIKTVDILDPKTLLDRRLDSLMLEYDESTDSFPKKVFVSNEVGTGGEKFKIYPEFNTNKTFYIFYNTFINLTADSDTIPVPGSAIYAIIHFAIAEALKKTGLEEELQ